MDRDLPARTSALRQRRIPHVDAQRLDLYLRRIAVGRHAVATADWLRAGILTGLRPCEWSAASLDMTTLTLVVPTAKVRGAPRSRHLDLSALDDADVRTVHRHLQRARSAAIQGDYATWQGQCAATVYAACKLLWHDDRHHYTLYSARHQAAANAKAIMPPGEVSALLGHDNERTAQRHYGRRTSAWPGSVRPSAAIPDPAEVLSVAPWTWGPAPPEPEVEVEAPVACDNIEPWMCAPRP